MRYGLPRAPLNPKNTHCELTRGRQDYDAHGRFWIVMVTRCPSLVLIVGLLWLSLGPVFLCSCVHRDASPHRMIFLFSLWHNAGPYHFALQAAASIIMWAGDLELPPSHAVGCVEGRSLVTLADTILGGQTAVKVLHLSLQHIHATRTPGHKTTLDIPQAWETTSENDLNNCGNTRPSTTNKLTCSLHHVRFFG